MKKIYALALALTVASVAALCVIAVRVNAQSDRVTITEDVLYGDRSAADGLAVTMKNNMDHRLFWQTAYTIGERPNIDTSYTFSAARVPEQYEDSAFSFSIESVFNTDLHDATPTGIQRAMEALDEATPNGERKTKAIRLKDYYEYYPLQIEVNLPFAAVTLDSGAALEKISDYIKIPVLDSDTGEIYVDKTGSTEWYSDDYCGMNSNYCALLSASAVAPLRGRCFFTVNNSKTDDYGNVECLDTSLIPGGYGIYSFLYNDDCDPLDDYWTYLKDALVASDLETVYTLDRDTFVEQMAVTADETKLLLYTAENNAFYLTVIDLDTMRALQKIRFGEGEYFDLHVCEGAIVANLEEAISVITEENGVYSLAYTVKTAESSVEELPGLWSALDIAYRDGKLAFVGNPQYVTSGWDDTCDFFVVIYDESGLRYYGRYVNSVGANASWGDMPNCFPDDVDPIRIRWA